MSFYSTIVMFGLPIVPSFVLTFFIDAFLKIPRIFTIIIATLFSPILILAFFYLGAGPLGLMSILLFPVWLVAGLVGTPFELKANDMIRELRGGDEI